MVIWSKYCHATGVVDPVYGVPTLPLSVKTMVSKEHTVKISK